MLAAQVSKGLVEAGCDEAGRGCLAGPVVAAAVILPADFSLEDLTDSKQLSEKERRRLYPLIKSAALAWAIAEASVEEIGKYNILNASILAMHRAIEQLQPQPEFLAIDGNRFKPVLGISHSCEVKGDGRFLHIAAASVLAKEYRDQLMLELHAAYPEYGWNKNKGYPTRFHRSALREFGPCPLHRLGFKLM
jgi:ribonuclease HII